MLYKQLMVRVLAAAVLLAGAWCILSLAAVAADEKKETKDKPPEKKSGSVTGMLTAKGDNYIEVKADGEEKARRYVPHWVGGAPADGGGPDKNMLKVIRELKVGSRLRIDWEFEERARVVKVDVLKAAKEEPKEKGKDKEADEKSGTAVGTLTAKGDNFVEVKADGEEKARRYVLHAGGTKELLQTMRDTEVGSRVRIEWKFIERARVLKMEVLKAVKKDK